jgi:protoporphyrinogen oxidase
LLAFPHLTWMDKARFSWSTLLAEFRNSTSWKDMEDISARDWLTRQYGERTYRMLYKPLLDSKFGEYASHISAAWMWARLHRLGNSRTVTQKECVGYVEGGSQVYVDALEQAIRSRRVEVQTSSVVEQIIVESGQVAGIRCNGALWPFDHVLSTVPIPFACKLVRVQGPYFDNLRQLEYIGVMVTLLRIRRQFSKYFWVNISDPRLALAGFIEYTNLNPCRDLGGDALIYLPQYLPHSHELYQMGDQALLDLNCSYLQIINPDFERSWVREYWIHRDRFAQPICEMGFSRHIPDIQTPIDNLFLTDSYQLHPYDRSISGSTWLGREAAQLILSKRKESARD